MLNIFKKWGTLFAPAPIKIKFSEKTDQGIKRERNEDAIANFPTKYGHLFVLCDGLGGHTDGDVASRLCVQIMKDCFEKLEFSYPETVLKEAIICSNDSIYQATLQQQGYSNMATTVVAALVNGDEVYFAHAGDSRLYHYKNSTKCLYQQTEDDIVIDEDMPDIKQLSKAVGLDEEMEPSVKGIRVQRKDMVLLCSDGLYNMLEVEAIEKILQSKLSLENKVDTLIEMANVAGGDDNISIQLIAFE